MSLRKPTSVQELPAAALMLTRFPTSMVLSLTRSESIFMALISYIPYTIFFLLLYHFLFEVKTSLGALSKIAVGIELN